MVAGGPDRAVEQGSAGLKLTSDEIGKQISDGSAARKIANQAEQDQLFHGGGVAQPRGDSLVGRIRGGVGRLLERIGLG